MDIVSETPFERGFSNTFLIQNKSMEKMAIGSNTSLIPGFSNTFVPNKDIGAMDLQFIEGGELERAWKQARRERLKAQQEKIWAEFVKENDQVLQTVHQEDKYQFIDTVPEECLKELLESETKRTTSRSKIKESQEELNAAGDSQDTSRSLSDADDNVFHIFDEDRDNDFSGDNEEALDDVPGTPSTVREGQLTNRAGGVTSAGTEVAAEPETTKSEKNNSEANMVNMIESSISCAKVKDLRAKIKEELQAMITTLEALTLGNVDPFELVKMQSRAAEYATRFQRIHLYQITRAIHDLQRHNEQALPYAKHTQFQSQMVRIVSLHTNMLQALQAFHKSLEQTACLDASSTALRALCGALQQGTKECLAVPLPAPTNCTSSKELYHDGLDSLCDQVVTCVNEYTERVSDILRAADIAVQHAKRGERSKVKKKSNNTWSRTATKNTASHSGSMGRLSMYSMETIKANPKLKHAQSTVKKMINGQYPKKEKMPDADSKKDKSPRSNRKTPRSRRPLMRAPIGSRARRADVEPLRLVDTDLHTMVEAVDAESTVSPIASPLSRRQPRTSRSEKKVTQKGERSPHVSPKPRNEPRAAKLHTPKGKTASTHTSPIRSNLPTPSSPRGVPDSERTVCDVNTILRQLCGGDANGSRTDRSVGNAKNAQLLCMKSSSSPRQPTTPQLLKILEETIQKKVPKSQESERVKNKRKDRDEERHRLALNTPQHVADSLTQYRTKFVQHMLTSNMYANSAVGLPWEKIGSIADNIISEVLVACAWEMELVPMVTQLYLAETTPQNDRHMV